MSKRPFLSLMLCLKVPAVHRRVNQTPPPAAASGSRTNRYQRVTAAPCERFAASPAAPPCKENLLRFCNTDLASVAYRWPRFVAEKRGFSLMESHGIGLNDGLLARLLRTSGWKVHRISDVCLLSHR